MRRARRGHGRPTLDDVAQAAGVTRITVSRYFRSPDKLSAQTTALVRAAVQQLGYVPNAQAGQLASGRSRIIAALVPSLGYSIFAETIQGLSEGLIDSGYELMLMPTAYSLEREEQQLRTLLAWSPSALVLTGRRHSPGCQQLLAALQAQATPVVEIWDRPGREDGPQASARIGFDHHHIGSRMAQCLLDLGHRHLGYVDSPVKEDYRARERLAGFAAAVRGAGGRVDQWVAPVGDGFDAGRLSLQQVLAQPVVPTALAFANDFLAAGAWVELQGLGARPGAGPAVLGFGDFPVSRQVRPMLSTVRTPNVEIGRAAAQTLLSAMQSGERPQGQNLACELLVRGSTPRFDPDPAEPGASGGRR